MSRGTFEFETTDQGDLYNLAENVKALRRMWLDRKLIDGEDLGPGDPGDFDQGAWHVACYLLGAGGVLVGAGQQFLWLEVSHDPARDEYYASVTAQTAAGPATFRLDSAEGRSLVAGAALAGFVEGNSVGRISARGANDPPELFNLWRRQDFDRPPGEEADGGKVWEHWCTLRDIRPSSRIGTSVLTAYVSLVSALGDRFAPAVARGRRDYGHPRQLRAMVKAGFIGKQSALWDTQPAAIPPAAEKLLLEAEPARSLAAAAQLDWSAPPRYYMFQRRIQHWSPADKVKEDLKDV
jgi:hypothetical protein